MTRHQHVPIVFFLDKLFQVFPSFVVHELRNRRLSFKTYQSVRDNREVAMPGRQVEVVHEIAVGIRVAKNPGSRIDRQLKNKTALVAFGSGVHTNFHHALPDEMAIAIAREMANGVVHLGLKSDFNRIIDIEFMNRRVQFAALLDNFGHRCLRRESVFHRGIGDAASYTVRRDKQHISF